MFEGMARSKKKRREPDCTCLTCKKGIHHLGIMSHRAMHRQNKEDCTIWFSSGKLVSYAFAEKA